MPGGGMPENIDRMMGYDTAAATGGRMNSGLDPDPGGLPEMQPGGPPQRLLEAISRARPELPPEEVFRIATRMMRNKDPEFFNNYPGRMP